MLPIYHRLVDYTEMYERLQEPPIIINDLPNITEEDRAYIDELIMTRYSTDMLSVLPSCRCGETKGEYIIGVICDRCNTPVKSKVDQDIEPLVWFRKPRGVAQLISPAILNMLKTKFKASGYDLIDWIIDTTYVSTRKTPDILISLADAGIQRGYNWFVDNFDFVINILFTHKVFRPKGGRTDDLWELIKRDRHLIFSDHLPLPNKALFIVENTPTGKYIDDTIAGAKDAINTIVSIDRRFALSPARIRENRTAKALSRLAKFYTIFSAKNISPKTGLIRRHVIATRSHFCFRGVITSITEPHKYDEIEIPWGVAITVFRVHLLSKLMKIGFSHNNAVGLMVEHVNRYHPLLDQLLHVLLDEAPDKRIACTLQRNPSLSSSSMQLVYIKSINTNPSDKVIKIPITNVRGFNADNMR